MAPIASNDESKQTQATIRTLVEAATNAVDSVPLSDNRSVVSAVLATDGRLFAGVNVYHFTGGPCAEIVVIGAAAGAGAAKLTHVVAVANRGRRVISPCGRCRQILRDYYPNIEVVMKDMNGEEVLVELSKLLPFSYLWKDDN